MGDADPQVARENSPNSLRALYGLSRQQNAVMGSSDTHNAELQIASLFASSPPFQAAELPDVSDPNAAGSYHHHRASGNPHSEDDHSSGSRQPHPKPKVVFRARPLPKTHDVPDIMPRTTRAAALRAGVVVEKTPTTPRAPLSKARLASTFANVPGHKRAGTIAVASTAPPVVAPRMTRAVALRLGQPVPAQPKRRPTSVVVGKSRAPDPATFEGVPGHKRRETISVASVKAPSVAPRINKSAALRVAKDTPPPSSYMCESLIPPFVSLSVDPPHRSPYSIYSQDACWSRPCFLTTILCQRVPPRIPECARQAAPSLRRPPPPKSPPRVHISQRLASLIADPHTHQRRPRRRLAPAQTPASPVLRDGTHDRPTDQQKRIAPSCENGGCCVPCKTTQIQHRHEGRRALKPARSLRSCLSRVPSRLILRYPSPEEEGRSPFSILLHLSASMHPLFI